MDVSRVAVYRVSSSSVRRHDNCLQTGAQYVTVFSYPKVEQYGLLSEAHFEVIKDFKRYVLANPQNEESNMDCVAYVLPDN